MSLRTRSTNCLCGSTSQVDVRLLACNNRVSPSVPPVKQRQINSSENIEVNCLSWFVNCTEVKKKYSHSR